MSKRLFQTYSRDKQAVSWWVALAALMREFIARGDANELAADRMLSSFLMAMPGALWQRAHLRKPTDPDRL